MLDHNAPLSGVAAERGTRPTAASRARLLSAYHAMARPWYAAEAARLGGDPEQRRRAALAALTGHDSAADCTDAELASAVRTLRRQGAGDARGRGGNGLGDDRPTPQQWATIARMARARGWDRGLTDPRLAAFVRRTAKVNAVRFLGRIQASAIITALGRWSVQDSDHQEVT